MSNNQRESWAYLEALICFGPLGLLLALGLLCLPVWAIMLVAKVFGLIGAEYELTYWSLLRPIGLVSFGVLGLIGLNRVISHLFGGVPLQQNRTSTTIAVLAGLFAFIWFNFEFWLNTEVLQTFIWHQIAIAFAALTLLPGLCTFHILWYSGRDLFDREG